MKPEKSLIVNSFNRIIMAVRSSPGNADYHDSLKSDCLNLSEFIGKNLNDEAVVKKEKGKGPDKVKLIPPAKRTQPKKETNGRARQQ